MPKRKDSVGQMTWNQSAVLWCSIAWRTILVGFMPVVIISIGLGQITSGQSLEMWLPFLLLIPIFITVQRHVINKIDLSDFDGEFRLEVNHRTSPVGLLLWEEHRHKRSRSGAFTDDPPYQLNRLA